MEEFLDLGGIDLLAAAIDLLLAAAHDPVVAILAAAGQVSSVQPARIVDRPRITKPYSEQDWQRILAARQRVLLARRLLEVEIRQFEQGLRTSTEVLDAQTKLASAQLSEISATTDYEISQIDLAFATGTVLGQSQVVWEPMPAPK